MDTLEFLTQKTSTIKTLLLTAFGVSALYAGYVINDEIKENDRLRERLSEQVQYAEKNEQALTGIENRLARVNFQSGLMPVAAQQTSLHANGRLGAYAASIDKIVEQDRSLIKGLTTLLGKKDQQLFAANRNIQAMQAQSKEEKDVRFILLAESQSLRMDLIESEERREAIERKWSEKNLAVDEKNQMISAQSAEIAKREIKIRTAYYLVGTMNDLQAKDVIERKGGVMGLGRTTSVKEDVDQKVFSQIDIYSFTNIPVFSKDVEIVSNHPADSYQLLRDRDGNVQWLQITDPDKFWEQTKYLVVQSKKPLSGKPLFFLPEQF